MGRITARRPVVRVRRGAAPDPRADTLAVEEPLELRVAGAALTVTMRTPGHDVELALGYLVAEGVITAADDVQTARYCAGAVAAGPDGLTANTYNVLDVALAGHVRPPTADLVRRTTTSSACGVCGATSLDAVAQAARFGTVDDPLTVDLDLLLSLPDRLRAEQAVFDKTGGLHAAALFDGATGELLVVREDVGRHNAVDKVVGWALQAGRLPLRGTVLQVSSRASFELVQKAGMAGVPLLAAVSAPSSLAAELADRLGITLAGFVRGDGAVLYSRAERVAAEPGDLVLSAPSPSARPPHP